jgi:hypothetical protein
MATRKNAAKKTTRQKALKKPVRKIAKKRASRLKADNVAVSVTDRVPTKGDSTCAQESLTGFGSTCAHDDRVDALAAGRTIHEAMASAADVGYYASAGRLNIASVNPVLGARKKLTYAAQALMDGAVRVAQFRNAPRPEQDVIEAEQRLAVARFELAVDELERAIRG